MAKKSINPNPLIPDLNTIGKLVKRPLTGGRQGRLKRCHFSYFFRISYFLVIAVLVKKCSRITVISPFKLPCVISKLFKCKQEIRALFANVTSNLEAS